MDQAPKWMKTAPKRAPLLSYEEECQLTVAYQKDGDHKALDRLVRSNQGLVISIAGTFHRYPCASFEDLVQEGQIGLILAAAKFDPDRGVRFATYATWWIRAKMILHVIVNHGPIVFGKSRAQRKLFFQLSRVRRKLAILDQEPTIEAIAKETGAAPVEIAAMAARINLRGDISLEENAARLSMGLQSKLPRGTLVEERTPEAEAADEEEHAILKKALKHVKLDPRDWTVLEARYLRKKPKMLAAIGKRLGVSKERVRQREVRAIAKLKEVCESVMPHTAVSPTTPAPSHRAKCPSAARSRTSTCTQPR